MHERFVVAAAVSAAGSLCSACPKLVQSLLGAAAARFLRDETVFCVRILDTTQIRRLSAFSFAADVTIQHFNESRQRSEMFS
jgi:hypothetical protein